MFIVGLQDTQKQGVILVEWVINTMMFNIESFLDDGYFLSLTEIEKEEFMLSPTHQVAKKIRGDIKYCPTCGKIRITSCCACGCGNCYTCEYRWTCNAATGMLFDGNMATSLLIKGFIGGSV